MSLFHKDHLGRGGIGAGVDPGEICSGCDTSACVVCSVPYGPIFPGAVMLAVDEMLHQSTMDIKGYDSDRRTFITPA